VNNLPAKRPPGKKKSNKLTVRDRRFIDELEKDWNATRAAIAIGFSEKSAGPRGWEYRHKPLIQAELERRMAERLQKMGVHAERVLQELVRIGLSDIRKIFNDDGSLKSITNLDDETAAALASVEVFEEFAGRGEDRVQIGLTKKVKVFDKVRALELLGKHLKLVGSSENTEVQSPVVFQTIIINKPENSGTGETD
jgi:phage terminase small subunit